MRQYQRSTSSLAVFVCEVLTLLFTATTFALAIAYGIQLARAPIDSGVLAISPIKGTLVPTYGLPPCIGILASVSILSLRFSEVTMARRRILVSGLLAVGWLVTDVIWGHCHTSTGPDDAYWYNVCYQANLSLDPLRNIVGVNEHLGTALVAMAALVIAMHLINMALATRECFVQKKAK